MLDRIVAGNTQTDEPPLSDMNNLRYHFNRRTSQSREDAIKEYVEEQNTQMRMFHQALENARRALVRDDWASASVSCNAALHIFGTLTHMWQDYYGHAVQNSATSVFSNVGVLDGSPVGPSPGFKPSSYAGIMGEYYGYDLSTMLPTEHGFVPRDHEPGTRNGQQGTRTQGAISFTQSGMLVFLPRYYSVCRCPCLWDRINKLQR